MSKYEKGDKIVIEITDRFKNAYDHEYCSILDSLYSADFIDKKVEPLSTYTEQARAEGQNEAWSMARKIFSMEIKDIEDIFIETGAWNLGTVLDNNTYPEAAAKVEAWEKAKEEIKDDEDCLKCQFFEKHNDEYPCSHCCHCYTSKFKQIGGESDE